MEVANFQLNNNLFLKQEYLNHPFVSGNKLRKLKYNLLKAAETNHTKLLTFGGAFSNHIAAVAYAGMENNIKTIGVIRGKELINKLDSNPTLRFARLCGMEFMFISRDDYRHKTEQWFIDQLHDKFKDFYLLPEGGTNELAIKGCEEILTEDDLLYDYICCPVGTGGTICGLINAALPHQKIIGFPALKGDFLREEITKFAKHSNWELITNFHFGGYGKVSNELIDFINQFKKRFKIPLDPIYTGKMLFGIYDLFNKNYFPENSKVLAIHTGGLQGIEGMNMKLKQQNKPLLV